MEKNRHRKEKINEIENKQQRKMKPKVGYGKGMEKVNEIGKQTTYTRNAREILTTGLKDVKKGPIRKHCK